MGNIKVDIILATYNGENYILEQLESILKQSYPYWNIYITDDGSSDNTISLIKKFIAENNLFNDITILPQRNEINKSGPAFNFIYGLSFSTSKYVMFSDQDDYWLPTKIESQLSDVLLLDKDKPALSFCDSAVVDENLLEIYNSFSEHEGFSYEKGVKLKNIIFQNIAPGCCMIFNDILRDLFLSKKSHRNMIMHDWYFLILCQAFGNVNFRYESLMKYRQHGSNQVGASKKIDLAIFLKLKSKFVQSYRNHLNAKLQVIAINELYNINCSNKTLSSLVDTFSLSYFSRVKTLYKMKVSKSSYLKTLFLYLFI